MTAAEAGGVLRSGPDTGVVLHDSLDFRDGQEYATADSDCFDLPFRDERADCASRQAQLVRDLLTLSSLRGGLAGFVPGEFGVASARSRESRV